ncbi:hypothetical protein ABGV42_12240 [Paenibacillus pabuli]
MPGCILCLFFDALSKPELPDRRRMPAVFFCSGNDVYSFLRAAAAPGVIEINSFSNMPGMDLIFNAGRMKSYDDIGTPT